MAAPGLGMSGTPFHYEYYNNNNSDMNMNPHYYSRSTNNAPQFYTPYPAPPPLHSAAIAQPPPPPLHPYRKLSVPRDNEKEIVRTLFISGLPEDVKPREIYNLFRRRQGFETCQLKYTGRGHQIVAFAVFSHQQHALAAKDTLNGLTFDPETGATLHIELARTNSRIKHSDVGHGPYDSKIRGPFGLPGVHDDDGVGDNIKMQGSSKNTQSNGALGASITGQDGKPAPTLGQLSGQGGNPPCPTLFIANLGPTCTNEELAQVLSRFKGFKMLKMQTKGGMPVAFVDFEDVVCSIEALKQLQGTSLPSSDRGGMHLEYAKSRMRYPRQDRQAENEIKQVFPFPFCADA